MKHKKIEEKNKSIIVIKMMSKLKIQLHIYKQT